MKDEVSSGMSIRSSPGVVPRQMIKTRRNMRRCMRPRCRSGGFWGEQGKRAGRDRALYAGQEHPVHAPRVDQWFEDAGSELRRRIASTRNMESGAAQTAIIFDPKSERSGPAHHLCRALRTTYQANVCWPRVMRGDRVVIYLPMIPEADYACWCARIGASIRSSSPGQPRRPGQPDQPLRRQGGDYQNAPPGGRPRRWKSIATRRCCISSTKCLPCRSKHTATRPPVQCPLGCAPAMEHSPPIARSGPMKMPRSAVSSISSGSNGLAQGDGASSGGYLSKSGDDP